MRKPLNIIGHRKIFLSVSSFFVLVSIISIIVFGFRTTVDFSGGTMWQIKFEKPEITVPELEGFFKAENISVAVTREASGIFILRLKELTESDHQRFAALFKQKLGNFEELRFDSLSPSIGKELARKSIWAMILTLAAIGIYVAWAFRKVSYPLKSWKYGAIVLVTLFHDVIIPIGVFSLLGRFLKIDIDPTFIAAILAIMGFSVNDTIVVFDRIRENLTRLNIKEGFDKIVNQSLNETLARSLNTNLTVFLVLLALYFLGPLSLQSFSLALLVGTVAGSYSSIFIASPLLVEWYNRDKKGR